MRPTLPSCAQNCQVFTVVVYLGPRDKASGLLSNLKDRRCQTFKPGYDRSPYGFFMIEKDEKAITLSIFSSLFW